MKALGRKVPPDFQHVEKYPLAAITPPRGVPVIIGVNWYSNFDNPRKEADGRYWIGHGDLGYVRGGHCVCLRPSHYNDNISWWDFYNQGNQGACVGYGVSRAMTLLNRHRYDARWLWDRAKEIDPWPDTNPGDNEGTDVNSACKVLRDRGHVILGQSEPDLASGISEYRWAKSATEVEIVLSSMIVNRLEAVPLLNSWGRDYPHIVWLPLKILDRLIGEDGEVAIITDR